MTVALKRLGGGRWETKDGRFAIEPESGTWVVVDNEQTDELGLALVRGPFPSLTAAKEAIDEARQAGAPGSPLAERLAKAKAANATAASGRRATPATAKARVPEPPPEPRWLRDLPADAARAARTLIQRLEGEHVPDPEAVARAQIADEQPALARLALERGLAAVDAADPADAVREAVALVLKGRDARLGATWRLVDGDGREIRQIDVAAVAVARDRSKTRKR